MWHGDGGVRGVVPFPVVPLLILAVELGVLHCRCGLLGCLSMVSNASVSAHHLCRVVVFPITLATVGRWRSS